MSQQVAKGLAFERRCSSLLQELGLADCRPTSQGGTDQGADLLATYGDSRYLFQCKDHLKPQGNRAIQEAVAAKAVYSVTRCGVISSSGYTDSAVRLARSNYCLLFTAAELETAVADGGQFMDLIRAYEFPTYTRAQDHHYDLIKKYEEVKARLGHTPRNSDFDKSTIYQIRKTYGNLTNLVQQLGDTPFTTRPSNQEIESEYRRVKAVVGKVPTLADMAKHSSLSRNCFASYPFTRLQRECGDRPHVERGVHREDLVAAFLELQGHLGRTPTLRELDENGKYRVSYYRRRWGNFDDFLKELRVPTRQVKQRRRYHRTELILVYLLLEKSLAIRQDDADFSLNHTVLEKLKYEGRTFLSPSTFSRRFGSWEAFLNAVPRETRCEFSKIVAELATRLADDAS